MDLKKALESASQLLNEELQRPTSRYSDNMRDMKELTGSPLLRMVAAASRLPGRLNLIEMRKQTPRIVSETPELYSFGGANYELLVAVFNRLDQDDRNRFIHEVLALVECGGTTNWAGVNARFPNLNGNVSELPLIAEFCIRAGFTKQLFGRAAMIKAPKRAIALLMMQIEETISLNFNLFSDEELTEIPKWLAPLRTMAELQTFISRSKDGKVVANPHYRRGWQEEAKQIVKSVDGIVAECAQARYFYLKGALQQTANFEVETDKLQVESFLKKLGFTQDLIQALDAAESNYRATSSAFELKSCVGLLRSVLESTHRDAAKSIAHSLRENPPQDWTTAVRFLVRMGLITPQQEKLVRGLYALLSDEGVHPILAKREFARLLRNMVIEYTLLFLTVLDKKGIAIAGEAGRAGDPGPDDPSKPR